MLNEAAKVARLFLRHGAQAVYLFGSVARTGAGRDIDLVVELPRHLHRRFSRHRALVGGLPEHYGDVSPLRLGYIGQFLEIPISELGYWFPPLDVHLVMPNWLQEFRGHSSIPTEARAFDPHTGRFNLPNLP
jgi:predicted nucleotidyltransferase